MRQRIKYLLFIVAILCQTAGLHAQNCQNTSVGLPPLNDLGENLWRGLQGGLYPNGQNTLPALHMSAGMDLIQQFVPLDVNGNPDEANGKIVLTSIGMSNTSLKFTKFVSLLDTVQNLHPQLAVVNGAQGGYDIDDMNQPGTDYWANIDSRLAAEGLSRLQVQALWFLQAERDPVDTTLAYIDQLKEKYKIAILNSKKQFPNLKIAYLSSRTYAGYANSEKNPEPFAYYSGWSVKRLIEDQISGDPTLAFTGGNAPAPWLAWGPYLWADGLNPRSDGLIWECQDYKDDGTHPSPAGQEKVALLLLDFFQNDPTTRPWFNNHAVVGLAEKSGAPTRFELEQNFPNPFNPATTIRYQLPQAGSVRLSIYNLLGQPVVTLVEEKQAAGSYAVQWDGRDHTGAPVASGTYFYRLEMERQVKTRKLVRMQ